MTAQSSAVQALEFLVGSSPPLVFACPPLISPSASFALRPRYLAIDSSAAQEVGPLVESARAEAAEAVGVPGLDSDWATSSPMAEVAGVVYSSSVAVFRRKVEEQCSWSPEENVV